MFKCIRRLVILGLVFFAGFQIHDTYVNVHNVLQYKTMVKEILATNDTTALGFGHDLHGNQGQ